MRVFACARACACLCDIGIVSSPAAAAAPASLTPGCSCCPAELVVVVVECAAAHWSTTSRRSVHVSTDGRGTRARAVNQRLGDVWLPGLRATSLRRSRWPLVGRAPSRASGRAVAHHRTATACCSRWRPRVRQRWLGWHRWLCHEHQGNAADGAHHAAFRRRCRGAFRLRCADR
jgi:hypothetical protein